MPQCTNVFHIHNQADTEQGFGEYPILSTKLGAGEESRDCAFLIVVTLYRVSAWQPLSHPHGTSEGRGPATCPPAVTPMAAVTSTFLLIWNIWLVLIRCFDNPEGQGLVSLLIQSSDACCARPPWPSANCGYWLIALINIYQACYSCAYVCPPRLCMTFKWRL